MLGPLSVEHFGAPISLGGRKQRAVLACLLAEPNRVVSVDAIADAVWGEEPPDRAAGVVQVYVSNLRRLLDPIRADRDGAELIVTRRPGYLVALVPSELDVRIAERHVADARAAAEAGRAVAAVDAYRQAESLWRGDVLADLADEEFVRPLRARLGAARARATEERLELELGLGRHRSVTGELEQLVGEQPLNEQLRAQLMLALYRSGRQADALAAFADGRRALVDELGIEPGELLRTMEHRILVHDPGLDHDAAPTTHEGPTLVHSSVRVTPACVVVDGRRVALLRPVTTIGRRRDRDIMLDDLDVSRSHAEIRASAAGFVLVDGGSTNGTLLNGQRVREHRLSDGDEIVIGHSRLLFEMR
jgi:DNA-binding SARP family transcriptional activator